MCQSHHYSQQGLWLVVASSASAFKRVASPQASLPAAPAGSPDPAATPAALPLADQTEAVPTSSQPEASCFVSDLCFSFLLPKLFLTNTDNKLLSNPCVQATTEPKTDLDNYEKEAYTALLKSKAKAKAKATAKAKGKAVAKPKSQAKAKVTAAVKAKPVAKVKAKAKAQAMVSRPSGQASSKGYYGVPPEGGPYGCIRCRGNIKGCSQCLQPGYGGLRFSSRANWATWHQAMEANQWVGSSYSTA